MTETQQTMTEFTYATGETDVIGDRFSPSVVLFWLKTSVAASNMRVMYKSPNTLLGVIPLGSSTQTIPLRNIASVDTNTKFNLGSFVWGAVFLVAGLSLLSSSALVGVLFLLLAAANLANTMSAQLDFVNQAGGRNSVKVSILRRTSSCSSRRTSSSSSSPTSRDNATRKAWTWPRSSTRPRPTAS